MTDAAAAAMTRRHLQIAAVNETQQRLKKEKDRVAMNKQELPKQTRKEKNEYNNSLSFDKDDS